MAKAKSKASREARIETRPRVRGGGARDRGADFDSGTEAWLSSKSIRMTILSEKGVAIKFTRRTL